MTTMISEVYDAFLSAGVDEEKSRKAAIALSESQLATKGDIIKLEKELLTLNGKITLLQWMVGLVIAVQVIPLIKNMMIH
ncbi:MAG: integrase [Magnetococcales bacterium]|nr:integrase [Magnetococcales bacterium]NGZ25959.1 integrase [Magnetococcales bacterium]